MPSYYPVNTLDNLLRDVSEHRLILEALKAGDAKGAVSAMRTHICHTQKMIVERMQEQ